MSDLLSDPNLHEEALARQLQLQEQELELSSFAPFDPSEPLPEYTRSWGAHLRRPAALPEHYDTRIDPNHIFLFAVHPITGIKRDFFVTPKPCEYCAKIRQVCSRSRPSCQRCRLSGDPDRVCHVEDGWVKLPGPKCEKPKLQKRPPPMVLQGGDGKSAKVRSSTSDNMPGPKRARTIAPHPFEDSLSSLSSTPTPSASNHYEPMSIPKKPPPKRVAPPARGENGKDKSASASTSTKEVHTNGKRRAAPQKGAKLKGKRSGRKHLVDSKGKEPEGGIWVANDGTIWRVVRPPPPKPSFQPTTPKSLAKLLHDEPKATKGIPQGQPRIWAKSKAEFLEILPELSNTLSDNGPGVYMEEATLEPPVLYLEGNAWPGDSLTEDGAAQITIVREFTIPTDRAYRNSGRPVDFGAEADMMLVDELSAARSSASTPSLHTSRSQSVSESRPPPLSCHPSQVLHAKSSQQSSLGADSSLRQVNEQRPQSNGHGIRKSYSPLSSKVPREWLHKSSDSSRPQPPTRPRLSGIFGNASAGSHQSNWHLNLTRKTEPEPCNYGAASSNEAFKTFEKEVLQPSPPKATRLGPASFEPQPKPVVEVDDDSGDEEHASSTRHANGVLAKMATNMDATNRQLIGMVPGDAPERQTLEDAQAAEEHRTTFVPEELPSELRHLLDCKTYNIPIVVIVSRDYPLLPFTLPDDCEICVLGFYKVLQVNRTTMVQSENADWRTVEAKWQFKLRWIPGGENMPEDQQPTHPWWQSKSQHSVSDQQTPTPYSLLPMHLRSDFADPTSQITVASEVYTRKGWHCLKCGKLNVQRLLCFQKCDKCQAGNEMLPVDAMYVRDPHKMTPDATPVDTYPERVSCSVIEGEKGGMRTFVYSFGDTAAIKHVFTCNRPAMQKQANQLFLDMQVHVPLTWQGAKTKLAAGPYFTYLAGGGHEGAAPSATWSTVPPCVKQAREMIEHLAVKNAGFEVFKVDQMTILGWHSPGSRKGNPLPAKGKVVAMLCLGADMELNIIPSSGYSKSENIVRRLAREDDEHDDSDLADADSSDEEALATRFAPPKVAGPSKMKKETESMFFTLVHGDMLMLSGDDFEYTLHRTGMSIVLIGIAQAPKGR